MSSPFDSVYDSVAGAESICVSPVFLQAAAGFSLLPSLINTPPPFPTLHSKPSLSPSPMAKRSKLIPSLLSDDSTFPPTPTTKRRISLSSSTVSVGCGCRPKAKPKSKKKKQHLIRYYYNDNKAAAADDKSTATTITITNTPPRRKIYNSEDYSDTYVSASPAFDDQKKTKQKTRFSNCSAETAWFSSDDVSKTFSADSSSSFSDSTPISGVIVKKKKKNHHHHVKKVKYYGSKNRVVPMAKKMTCNSPESGTPVDEDEEGKMKESLAVMKKSEDPYGDFRRSMMEMIVEKEMFETRDLELLLQCFLSLNSRHHYAAIIEAFSDIWEILFSKSSAM